MYLGQVSRAFSDFDSSKELIFIYFNLCGLAVITVRDNLNLRRGGGGGYSINIQVKNSTSMHNNIHLSYSFVFFTKFINSF